MNWIDKQEHENPEMTRDQLRLHCKRNCPLTQRSGLAYKGYLKAMREKFGDKRIQRVAEKAGQVDLFN
ncbi:hypothetical protein [Hydrogenovibrio marinus]|uniref:hypothetical protein n=1 Tax=Hydrogenovibrio marinus TaxID=28885 RepID=UPI0012DBF5FD|nr:hypothetical protein [Hydrogenovibrio marinus]